RGKVAQRAFLSRHLPHSLAHRVAQLALEFSPTQPHPGRPPWRPDFSSLPTGFHQTLAWYARCSHPPSQLTIGPGQFVEPDSASRCRPSPLPFRHSVALVSESRSPLATAHECCPKIETRRVTSMYSS
ncbi:hypothetical protein EV363DRAFT_1168344, partial [Boletus edulis]